MKTRTIWKDAQTKGRNSSWFLTLNTNREVDEVPKEKLKEAANKFFGDLPSFLKFKSYNKDKNNQDAIDDIRVTSSIEVGKTKRCCHLHSLISIDHQSNLQLDYGRITKFFEGELGVKGVYLHCEVVPQDTDLKKIKSYISKDG